MRILKNGQEQTWLGIQSVDGALYSVNEDEPVFLTIRTNQSINYVASNLASFTLEHLGIQQTLQLADVEIVGKINLASGGYLYTYRLLCKKSSTDFTPKTWYKQQYTALNTRYGHLSGQLQVAEYQVTNLLGSDGSFSVDSDNDGVADGWNTASGYISDFFSLVNGIQRMEKKRMQDSVWYFFLRYKLGILKNKKIFIKAQIISNNQVSINHILVITNSNDTERQLTIRLPTTGVIYDSTYVNSNSDMFVLFHWGFQQGHILEIDNIIVIDLTTMGELPQPLKQFFAPSNITKWEDFATFGNTNVMCVLKDANGNYIAKKGNDWLNDLIPYVENTANIRLPVYI